MQECRNTPVASPAFGLGGNRDKLVVRWQGLVGGQFQGPRARGEGLQQKLPAPAPGDRRCGQPRRQPPRIAPRSAACWSSRPSTNASSASATPRPVRTPAPSDDDHHRASAGPSSWSETRRGRRAGSRSSPAPRPSPCKTPRLYLLVTVAWSVARSTVRSFIPVCSRPST